MCVCYNSVFSRGHATSELAVSVRPSVRPSVTKTFFRYSAIPGVVEEEACGRNGHCTEWVVGQTDKIQTVRDEWNQEAYQSKGVVQSEAYQIQKCITVGIGPSDNVPPLQ